MIFVIICVAVVAAGVTAFLMLRPVRAMRRELDARERAESSEADRVEASETERVLLLEALRGFPDGVVVVAADGDVVARNAVAERFSGARHADALAEEVIGELLERALHGEPGERELQLFGPPREVLLVRALPLRQGTGIVGAAAFVHDLSEARRVESVRRDFVANVSHELKTPIGALALLSETMAAETDPAVMHQLAERVLGEADRLGRIVDDLLDLSLIEAQEAPIRECVAVPSLLQESAERVHAVAEAAGIPLRVAPVSDDLIVTCDRAQVVSAITNLLDNAVKYSEAGEAIELGGEHEGDFVAIVVRDHGVGIPSRDLERIFERFYRVDRARSRTTGGIGLGLSIVRHVAQAHGGDVTVKSREGEGSTFCLRLPLSNAQVKEAS
ncbi:MAG TPA: ATP-binding protein [Acidimicrobiia bacterium]|nr:ATP-binding protein [Acidimicrobiia bacterium]